MELKNRIIEYKRIKAKDLCANPNNFRLHPENQRDALDGVLTTIGQADSLLAYYSKRNDGKLTLIDGHLRQDLDPEQEWGVQVTDLTDEEADLLISMLDPIGAMATMDAQKFLELQEIVTTDDWRVREALRKLALEAENALKDEAEEDEKKEKPTGGPEEMELLPFEHYDYVLLMFKNELDWISAQETLGIVKRSDPRRTNKIGLGRVIDGARVIRMIKEAQGQKGIDLTHLMGKDKQAE